MDDLVAHELKNLFTRDKAPDSDEAFARAFEITRAYAASANAQAAAVPALFEKLFELFLTGRSPG